MKKLFLVFAFFGFFFVSFVESKELICSDRNVGPASSAFVSRKAAESWYPKYIRLTDTEVQFGTGPNSWYESSRNTGQNFENASGAWGGHLYKFKYKRSNNKLTVIFITGGNYKNANPVIYKFCEILGASSGRSANTSSAVKSAFLNLSSCDRRYVQQFLLGQGLYNGALDGIWGQGTASALEKAKNIGKLKGKSVVQIIDALSENPICD